MCLTRLARGGVNQIPYHSLAEIKGILAVLYGTCTFMHKCTFMHMYINTALYIHTPTCTSIIIFYTSANNGDVGWDAPCKKSWKQGNPLSNPIKNTSTIMLIPLAELCREGLSMIVLVCLIVLLRGFCCLQDFLHSASHPYIPIQIFLHLFHILKCMRRCIG